VPQTSRIGLGSGAVDDRDEQIGKALQLGHRDLLVDRARA
jgi:hypothetical protein